MRLCLRLLLLGKKTGGFPLLPTILPVLLLFFNLVVLLLLLLLVVAVVVVVEVVFSWLTLLLLPLLEEKRFAKACKTLLLLEKEFNTTCKFLGIEEGIDDDDDAIVLLLLTLFPTIFLFLLLNNIAFRSVLDTARCCLIFSASIVAEAISSREYPAANNLIFFNYLLLCTCVCLECNAM